MKNSNNPKKENFDNCFKDAFGDFEAMPSKMNWSKISSQLGPEKFDATAKNKLHQLEVTPQPHIWENVRKKLPLSLFVRNQLNWLSAVAAALTIFMVVMIALDNNNTVSEQVVVSDDISEPLEEMITIEPEQDFVYAIDEPNTKIKKKSVAEAMSEEDEEAIANFWDDFLDEDEDLVAEVDDALVEESLEPIEQLPIENLEAALLIQTKEPQQIIVGKSHQNVLRTILEEKIDTGK